MVKLQHSFKNKQILRTATREFWFERKLRCPCSPIFIEDHQKQCWKFYYNDETEIWDFEISNILFPDIGTFSGYDEVEWRDVQLSTEFSLIGQTIKSFHQEHSQHSAFGYLVFASGWILKTTHIFLDDMSSYAMTNQLPKYS